MSRNKGGGWLCQVHLLHSKTLGLKVVGIIALVSKGLD